MNSEWDSLVSATVPINVGTEKLAFSKLSSEFAVIFYIVLLYSKSNTSKKIIFIVTIKFDECQTERSPNFDKEIKETAREREWLGVGLL
jgi:hypothetical protein